MADLRGTVDSLLYEGMFIRAAEKNYFNQEKTIKIDPEMLKITYYEMLEEANVDILLYSTIVDMVMEGDTVVGVVGK